MDIADQAIEAFNFQSARWPLVSVLVWIATRNEYFAVRCAKMRVDHADTFLVIERAHSGLFAGDIASGAWTNQLAPALDSDNLKAIATCAHVNKLGMTHVSHGHVFPPREQPLAASQHYIAEADEGNRSALRSIGDQHECVEWREVTFSREDVLRLWPEPSWIAAQKAKKAPWVAPTEFPADAINELGDRPRVAPMAVVRLLVGGQTAPDELEKSIEIAERLRAAKALFHAARNGAVTLYGRFGTEHTPKKIDAAIFDVEHTLVGDGDTAIEPDLDAVQMGRFVELRWNPLTALWFDVHVERQSSTKWLGELVTPPAIVAPIASTDTSLPLKPGSSEQIYLTGAPGRPTSKQLVVADYQARIHDKRNETVLKREAETLAAWLAENHPSAPRMRVGKIENAIRERRRRVKPQK